jgi:hypothetical protein
MSQRRLHSAVEAAANVAIGFGVALATQVIVFPWFGLAVALTDQVGIALIFTAVSIVRSYAVRRLFNAIT